MDKEALFRPRLPEQELEIPGVATIRVRALSRVEAILVKKAEDMAAQERLILKYGVMDPKLTDPEIGRWQRASAPSELEMVTRVIGELSGAVDGEAYKSVRGDAGSGVRILPGEPTEDDGDADASGDESG